MQWYKNAKITLKICKNIKHIFYIPAQYSDSCVQPFHHQMTVNVIWQLIEQTMTPWNPCPVVLLLRLWALRWTVARISEGIWCSLTLSVHWPREKCHLGVFSKDQTYSIHCLTCHWNKCHKNITFCSKYVVILNLLSVFNLLTEIEQIHHGKTFIFSKLEI